MSDLDELKNMGLKVTFPRMKVLDVFRKGDTRHLSADDVYRLLVADNVDIGLATVYRVLTQFEQAGLLKRSQFVGGKAVFELTDNERHHGHMVCTQTGKVTEFHDPKIEERLHEIASELGFNLAEFSITLYGTGPGVTDTKGKGGSK
jgi:Fur family ferric uptake transcriptional regulator